MRSDWTEVRLDELKSAEKGAFAMGPFGSRIKSENFLPYGIPVIKGGNLNGDFLNEASFDYLSKEKAEELSTSAAKRLDLVVTHRGTIGQVGIIPEHSKFEKYIVSQSQLKLSFNLMKVNPYFVYYFLRSPEGKHRLLMNGSQVGVPAIAQALTSLRNLRIPIPGKEEQDKIVNTLRCIDDKITLLRETNTTLEAIAEAIFKSWFVDFDPVRAKAEGREPEGMPPEIAELFPSEYEESELELVPMGWEAEKIGNIANVVDCLHSKKPELLVVGHPFLQLNNIRDDGLLDTSELACISEADYQKWISRIEVNGGDCVITNVGRVGAVALIPEGFKAAMGRNMTAIRLRPEYHYPTYLIELLQSSWMKVEIENKTDSGTILNALNVKSIPLLRCVLAPHAVMEVFESITRPLRAGMEENVKRIQTIASLRDTLLPRLMSGKLRIPDAGGIAL